MRNEKELLDLVKRWEGLRLEAYRDTGGVWTIGYGNTYYADKSKVKQGDKVTQAEAEKMLIEDLEDAMSAIDELVRVPLTDGQHSALTSFIFNIGKYAFKSSTMLIKLNKGDYVGAANEFPRWNKDNGKVIQGLINRRVAEKNMFNTLYSPTTLPDSPTGGKGFWHFIESLITHIAKAFTTQPTSKTYSIGTGPRITREEVQAILKSKGADLSKVCLLGVRGYYLDSMGVSGKNDRGIYDDALIWHFPDGFLTFRANTDPGIYRKGSGYGSKKGVANLKKGHWKYKTGIHYGSFRHAAFRQAANVTVIRDGNPPYEDTGMFGINIHQGGVNSTSSIGCVTLPKAQWKSFKETGYSRLKQYNQSTFSFVLIDELERR